MALAVVTPAALDDQEPTLGGAGRELSEVMSVGTDTGVVGNIIGFSGLAAPQPTAQGVVLSLPGLQEGPAAGLGFAAPFNVLTPQVNPLSGSMGRCLDLAGAGFFARDPTACERHFQPR